MTRWSVLVFAFTVAIVVACNGSTEPNPSPSAARTAKPAATPSVRDQDVQRALVLESAVERAERELAQLEAAHQPDAEAIADKKKILLALHTTLDETEARIDRASVTRR